MYFLLTKKSLLVVDLCCFCRSNTQQRTGGEKGFDTKTHTLATFGGAGAQHACSIARMLGIRTIFIHRYTPLTPTHIVPQAPALGGTHTADHRQTDCHVPPSFEISHHTLNINRTGPLFVLVMSETPLQSFGILCLFDFDVPLLDHLSICRSVDCV